MRDFVIDPAVRPRHRRAASGRIAQVVADRALRIGDMLLLWMERRRQRRALAMLSDHMLKDLGLSRSDAGHECGKRFWES